MLLIPNLKKKEYDKEFIYSSYLKKVIINSFKKMCVKKRFIKIDERFKINSFESLLWMLFNMKITETPSEYLIYVDGDDLNKITYGARDVRGYPILIYLKNYLTENIEYIYKNWMRYE